MATRSTIKIQGVKCCKVYKHWDGYPDAMLKWLQDFNLDFVKNRGNDPEYKMAQLLRFSALKGSKYDLDPSLYTGWGIIPFRADYGQDYEYTLKADGTVTVKEITP